MLLADYLSNCFRVNQVDGLNVMFKGAQASPLEGTSLPETGQSSLKGSDSGGTGMFGGVLKDKIEQALEDGSELSEISNQILSKLKDAMTQMEMSVEDIMANLDQIMADLELDGQGLTSALDIEKLMSEIQTIMKELELPDARIESMMAEVADKLDSSLGRAMEAVKGELNNFNIMQKLSAAEDSSAKVTEIDGDDLLKHFNLNDDSKSKDYGTSSELAKAMGLKDADAKEPGVKELTQLINQELHPKDTGLKGDDTQDDLKRLLLNSANLEDAAEDLTGLEKRLLKSELINAENFLNKQGELDQDLEIGELMSKDLKFASKSDLANQLRGEHGISSLSQINQAGNQIKQMATTVAIDGKPGTPQFKEGLNEKVLFMVKNDLNGASIKLNPPELGPLEINIKINHNRQAELMITTQHTLVKESVEHAMPRLRELLSDSGIQLNNVNVNDNSTKQHAGGQAFADNQEASDKGSKSDFFNDFFGDSGDGDSNLDVLVRKARPNGLVDFYA